jgi:hypothetical protein
MLPRHGRETDVFPELFPGLSALQMCSPSLERLSGFNNLELQGFNLEARLWV